MRRFELKTSGITQVQAPVDYSYSHIRITTIAWVDAINDKPAVMHVAWARDNGPNTVLVEGGQITIEDPFMSEILNVTPSRGETAQEAIERKVVEYLTKTLRKEGSIKTEAAK